MVTAEIEETGLKKRILTVLEHHDGKQMAIKGMELAYVLELRDDRIVQQAIRELIHDGFPICSTCKPPFGYFMPQTIEETYEYEHQVTSRAIEDFKRRRDFRKACKEYFTPGRQWKLI